MAVVSGISVTSLPNHRDKLFERIQQSVSSFEHEAIGDSGCEYYMFVLESAGEVVGTASINASAGSDEPFYSYRSETFVHASRALQVNNRVHVLNMCHDLTGMVQLCGFYVDPAQPPVAAELLSRARLLFIGAQRQRFGRRIIAEMPGLHDAAGQSPFWDAIGRRFFNMDFLQVEQAFVSRSKTFIAELMPSYPIYVPLLPDEAQHVIGQIHPDFELPCQFLSREGFEADNYIDIFDGGAVLTAELDRLYTMEHQRQLPIKVSANLPAAAVTCLVSNQKSGDFAATATRVAVQDGVVIPGPEAASMLGLNRDGRVRMVGLQQDAGRCSA
ncbi:arginine N-succinyltransferase [Paludibacterium denitrificans]|uniref:arginine N-succinyltransferase n=1 Tax=Paludibacterium denitrificans TaxID=2675226 RepID=UPI001E579980|nr:arginine N-succinyltransferase [Paludibacterium denitrificans]